jgi:NADH-quinone oxidoreductase subunit L
MFLALGVGSWAAAMFHFMTHAFFKALLFLASGVVIEALHHEHNIFRMGGLRKELPIAFWTFLIGGCSLAGLPLVTAGYFSKDFILWGAWTSPQGNPAFWIVGVIGVLLTGLYTFRLIFVVFFGTSRTPVTHRPHYRIIVPVILLATLSIVGGWFKHSLVTFLNSALPPLSEVHFSGLTETLSSTVAGLAFLLGLGLAYLFFLGKPEYAESLMRGRFMRGLHAFWCADWGFDWLYDRTLVRPFIWIATLNKRDVVDNAFTAIARCHQAAYYALSRTESGRLRWYVAAVAAGAVVFIGVILFT